MAFITACNLTSAVKNEKEVIEWIYGLSFGWFLLLAMTVGIAGYIFSRVYLTFNNEDYDGSNDKPYYRRFGYLINAFGYCLLLFTCITVLLGTKGDVASNFNLKILPTTVGKLLVYIVALGLAVSMINEWWISLSNMINKMTLSDQLTDRKYKYLMLLGRVGRFSRGIVFGTLAYVLARSTYYDLENLPEGADAAFAFISATYGAFIMAVVAFGVICYGLFLILSARHRNIPIS